MPIRVELWSDLACKGGVRLALVPVLSGSRDVQSLSGAAGLEIRAPWDAPWLADYKVRRVIRVVDLQRNPDGTETERDAREWRVSGDGVQRTGEPDVVAVQGVSPLLDLGSAGAIRAISPGGATRFNHGLIDSTPGQYIDTFVFGTAQDGTANLAADGLSWLQRGTIEPAGRYSIGFDGWSRLQLLTELASRSGGELRLRRNGSSGYYLDLLDAGGTGSSAETVVLRLGRNLLALYRDRVDDDFASVLTPAGMVVAGGVEAEGIGRAAWKVTQVGVPSTGWLTLADPATTDRVIAFDDQFGGAAGQPNCYLLKPDGTLAEIDDTDEAGQRVHVASASGIAAGDHVEIRAGSDGTQLTELRNPAAVAEYGRAWKRYEVEGARGERNHVPNGLLRDWTPAGDAVVGKADGAQTGTSIALKGLPASAALAQDDVLVFDGSFSVHLTAAATASGSGNVTVAVSTSLSVIDNQQVVIHRLGARPTGWTEVVGTLFRARRPALTGSLSAQIDGAHSASRSVKLKGLAAGTVIQAGDKLSVANVVILSDAIADGTGRATVWTSGYVTLADNTAVSVTRPALAGGAGVGFVALPYTMPGLLGREMRAPGITIRHDATIPRLWVSAGLTFHNPGASFAFGGKEPPPPAGSGLPNEPLPPKLRLLNGSGTELASVSAAARTLAADAVVEETLRVAYTLTSSLALVPAVRGIHALTGVTVEGGAPYTYVRWVTLTLGPDPEVPEVDGSHANALWHATQKRLKETSKIPTTYRVSLFDLSRLTGVDWSFEQLVLGGTVELIDEVLALDVEARIVELQLDFVEPLRSTVLLDTAPSRASGMLARRGTPRAFLQLDVAASTGSGQAGGGTGGNVSTTQDVKTIAAQLPDTPNGAPAAFPGALRGVPDVTQQGATSGAVPLKPYTSKLKL